MRADEYSELKERKYVWRFDHINLEIKVLASQRPVATQDFGMPNLKIVNMIIKVYADYNRDFS